MARSNPLQPQRVAWAVVIAVQVVLLVGWILGRIDWPWWAVTLPTWAAFGVVIATHIILAIDEAIEHYTRIR